MVVGGISKNIEYCRFNIDYLHASLNSLLVEWLIRLIIAIISKCYDC
jgi:hypothetical protein